MAFATVDGGSGLLPLLDVQIDVTNAPTSGSRTWTSVVNRVRSCAFTRSGRNDEFQRTSPGTLTLALDNRGDAITALGVKKAQWVRVLALWSATTVELWRGIITSAPRQWPAAGHDALINLAASDSLYLLRLYDLAGNTFPSQRSDQRLSTILGLVGAPVGTLDTQTDTIDAVVTPLSLGSDALSQSLAIEASDNGLLIANPTGTISYQSRHYRTLNSTSPVVTLDEASGVNYQDTVTYEDDDSRLANVVSVTPLGASTPQVATDTASQALYFTRRNQTVDRQLLSSDTGLATYAAQYLVNRYKDPPPRLPAVSFDLVHGGSSMLAILNLANSQRVTWKRQAATAINVDGFVEQIQHTIAPGTHWTVSLQLSPTTGLAEWILGDAVNGRLGITTGLAY